MGSLNEVQDFPIIFKFCVSESTHRESNENYLRFGYNNERDFYTGKIYGNKNPFVGWWDWGLSGSNVYLSGMSGYLHLCIYDIQLLTSSFKAESKLA